MRMLHQLGNRVQENYRQLRLAALELELSAEKSPEVRDRRKKACRAFAFHTITSAEIAGGFLVMMLTMIVLRPFGTSGGLLSTLFWVVGFIVHYWFVYLSQAWLLRYVFFSFGILAFDLASIGLYTTTSVSSIVLANFFHPNPGDIDIIHAILGMGSAITTIILFSTAFRIMHSHPFYRPLRGPAKLMQLLPPAQKGEILSFSANDHYLDIITLKGPSLIRISFSDAVNMMNTNDGIQVHRSHWVSRNAINSIERPSGSNHVVILTNGRQFPIARGRLATVKAYVDEVKNEPPIEEVRLSKYNTLETS